MKKFSVVVELEISEADYNCLHEDNEGWTIESEVTSWLSDLGFKVNDVRTYDDSEEEQSDDANA
jgi:hypothetical protein